MAKKSSSKVNKPKRTIMASIIPTMPTGKPPKRRPGSGIKRKRSTDGRFA